MDSWLTNGSEKEALKSHPHASIMYQEVKIRRGCAIFQIKFQILAFFTDVCTAHNEVYLEFTLGKIVQDKDRE